ncbi:MAG: hypothetical protein JWR19_4218 [Pedosphaera sp.]|nr:hypothetical protein [Pedosphaera sp.]
MKTLALLLALLSLSLPALAKLGETEAQTQARYGKPIEPVDVDNDLRIFKYLVRSNEVTVSFLKGESIMELITPPEEKGRFTREECQVLIAAISGKPIGEWKLMATDKTITQWSHAEGFSAIESPNFTPAPLTVSSPKSLEHYRAKKAAEKKASEKSLGEAFGGPAPK